MDTTCPQSLRHTFSATTTSSPLAECVSIPTAPLATFDISNTLDCYHCNQQYSITALTNNTGTVVERYSYSAYGQPTILDSSLSLLASSAYDNRYTYTGREWDAELKMYHYRARMYDPGLGTFCSRDPILYEGSRWNLMRYVDSRPLVAVDFSGLRYVRPLYCHGTLTQLPDYSISDSGNRTVSYLNYCVVQCVCANGDTEFPDRMQMLGPDLTEAEWRRTVPPYIPYPGTWEDQCDDFAGFWANEEICDCGGDRDNRPRWPAQPEVYLPEHHGLQPSWSPLDVVACGVAGGLRLIKGVWKCIYNMGSPPETPIGDPPVILPNATPPQWQHPINIPIAPAA